MHERFSRLPRALAERTRATRVASDIPALVAHPDPAWLEDEAVDRAPLTLWFHGRTAFKELDPGRYLRWIREGIGACAVDLPGHGERRLDGWDRSGQTLKVVEQAVGEVDDILDHLATTSPYRDMFDFSRVAIGGMSAGGMVTLVRLTRAHDFVCAAVESTAGDFSHMAGTPFFVEPLVHELNPAERVDAWRPIPFLALHSEADQTVPVSAIRSFARSLRDRYESAGADPSTITFHTWPETGAPSEHAGFGRVANDAKNVQTDFLKQHLLASRA